MGCRKEFQSYEMSDIIEGSAYVDGQRLYSLDASSCRSSKTSKNSGGSTGSRGSRGAVGTTIGTKGLDGLVVSIDKLD